MNKYLLLVSLFLWIAYAGFAQNFKGQWKGTFLDKSTSFVGWGGDRCDYVLELEVSGKDVNGYSYTYFTVRGDMQDAFLKKGFGIGRTFSALSPTLRIDYIFADKNFKINQPLAPVE